MSAVPHTKVRSVKRESGENPERYRSLYVLCFIRRRKSVIGKLRRQEKSAKARVKRPALMRLCTCSHRCTEVVHFFEALCLFKKEKAAGLVSLCHRKNRVDAEKDGCGDESVPRLLLFSQTKERSDGAKICFSEQRKKNQE